MDGPGRAPGSGILWLAAVVVAVTSFGADCGAWYAGDYTPRISPQGGKTNGIVSADQGGR